MYVFISFAILIFRSVRDINSNAWNTVSISCFFRLICVTLRPFFFFLSPFLFPFFPLCTLVLKCFPHASLYRHLYSIFIALNDITHSLCTHAASFSYLRAASLSIFTLCAMTRLYCQRFAAATIVMSAFYSTCFLLQFSIVLSAIS